MKSTPSLINLITACLVVVVVTGQQTVDSSTCNVHQSCGACFTAAAECAWCRQADFDQKDANERCDIKEKLLANGCKEKNIVHPDHNSQITQNEGFRNQEGGVSAVQLSPQEIRIKIRPNKPFKFETHFRLAENYPVDLYYLMDLSNSMADDKEKIAALGNLLAERMKSITKNFRLGFGSFVDKRVMPYVNELPSKLRSPCAGCVPPYGFKNQLSLNPDSSMFERRVRAARVSGNLDAPEGGFDAIMQAIACKNQIGWREGSRKMMVFSTDSGFHTAGDGKLGGIVKPNDGQCHLDNQGVYTESIHQDYPSISQISSKVMEDNVNMIFAVTTDQVKIYSDLTKFIEGSTAGELANDSSNVVELVQDNYNKISSKVQLSTEGAEDIEVKFYSRCFGSELKETDECAGLKVGTNVTFEVSVNVKKCPEDPRKRQRMFSIYPVGLTERLQLKLDLNCECGCEASNKKKLNSPLCTDGNGTYVCGRCDCNENRYGKFCECSGSDLASADFEATCRMGNSTTNCENRGRCECGVCKCFSRGGLTPNMKYSGKYCECDDYSCNYAEDNGLLCGGPTRGKCECGTCKCLEGFNGTACQCPISQESCRAKNGKICNGAGVCDCGVCKCEATSLYSGPTCEDCPACPGKCEQSKACVQCIGFGTGPISGKECKQNCTNIEMVDKAQASENQKICQYVDDDDCTFYFTYEYDEFGNVQVKAQRTKKCPEAVNVLAIVLGVIGGIVAIGLVLLLIWRLLATLHDRRECAKLQNDGANPKWDAGENPIFVQATSTFNNPTYAGKK
ncbi:integrin beta pat-3-like [Tubulanus polymorphus]|uniref:integrin beta pat-3-like n=1 Tax=Tubulanus polymorphus TaxID=672921 RepID=UPI003DA2AB10